MTASVTFLTILVGCATLAAALTPLILISLWIFDLRHGRLW